MLFAAGSMWEPVQVESRQEGAVASIELVPLVVGPALVELAAFR